jgi:hypothetical protein
MALVKGVLCVVFVAAVAGNTVRAEMLIDLAHSASSGAKEAVLFPFDSYSIPLRKGLEMTLLRSEQTRASYNPVLARGKTGTPDSFRIGYYGTVLEIDGRFHMWYIGDGDQEQVDQDMSTPYMHVLYATSDDGIKWQRPNLGLVEYNGSKNNNLVQINTQNIYRSCTVLYEPEDPDPERRYKMCFEGKGNKWGNSPGNVLFSRDGLVWNPSKFNPTTDTLFEQSGIIHRDGMYYFVGQVGGSGSGGFTHRALVEYLSPDFEHWTDAVVLGFRRDPVPPRNVSWMNNTGPQVHLGAGFWDRGNIIIGLYGQWNGDSTDHDRRYMKMNLGMVITHDGMHFDEPVPDFKMIKSEEENWSLDSMGSSPRITQGQGFINHGDKTITYFGHWGKDGNKGIQAAVWDRDRLGQYAVNRHPLEGQYPASTQAIDEANPAEKLPCFISCPITLPEGGGRVFLNCGNLSKHCELRVSLVDRNFNAVDGYSVQDCEPVQSNGYRVSVTWKGKGKDKEKIRAKGPIRLRVQWGGVRFEDPVVYAVYVTP